MKPISEIIDEQLLQITHCARLPELRSRSGRRQDGCTACSYRSGRAGCYCARCRTGQLGGTAYCRHRRDHQLEYGDLAGRHRQQRSRAGYSELQVGDHVADEGRCYGADDLILCAH